MRFDDDRACKLTAAERREFYSLAERLTERPQWHRTLVLVVTAVAALVGLVLSLGRTPVIVPFAAFVLALVALHRALARGRADRVMAWLARTLGLAPDGG